MLHVASMLYGIVAFSLAGAGVIAVLASGISAIMLILTAATTGAILALPATYFLASRLVR